MHSRGSSSRLKGMADRKRISHLMLSMLATFASIYVAGRIWQDSQSRVYLIKELDRITGQGQSAISVDDTLKIIACREQHKRLATLETELASAQQEGFISKHLTETNGDKPKRRPLLVIGVFTAFNRKNNRNAIRKAWMGTGEALKKMEDEKGIIARFVIGKSANQGDSFDRGIETENRQTNDFIILVVVGKPTVSTALQGWSQSRFASLVTANDDLVEAPEDTPKKVKLFFAYAAEKWDAEYYAKVKDDIYLYINPLAATLVTHLDKPRLYIGCMKSGEVFSEKDHKWYEPDWWKFGDKKSYFRHASGEMYVISRALAQFISINRSILRTYAHDDVTAGSWFLGVDAKYIDDSKFCCSTGAFCAGV